MTDVEELLRASLHDHAVDAPEPGGLAKRVHRRQRLNSVSAVTAVVTAVVGIAVGIGITTSRDEPRISTNPMQRVEGTRTVSYHGIVFEVPVFWGTNNQGCGQVSRNTVVVFAELPPIGCPYVQTTLKHNRVLLEEGPASSRPTGPVITRHGVTEEVSHVTRKGQTQTIVVIRSVNVRFAVYTADPAVGQRIVDSIRLAATSPEGCTMHDPTVGLATYRALPSGNPLLRPFLPPHPTSVADCQYIQGWLSGSTTLNRNAAQRLVRDMSAAPPGGLSLGGRSCPPPIGGYGFALRAQYADGTSSVATVGESCGETVGYNGNREISLSKRLLHHVTGPLNTTF